MPKQLIKTAVLTDIHFGRKHSSETHNQNCLDYIAWFVEQVKTYGADHIIFTGDWFETRNSINTHTMDYAFRGLKMMMDLNIPIFMVVGNHDCYYKHTRKIHSLTPYKEYPGVHVIDEVTLVKEIGNDGGALLVPYLFGEEYESLKQYTNLKTWWGHFEFQGFVITGQNHVMPTGPNALDYDGPRIFSGHFHKRQTQGQVTYVGNTFPMDYSDAGDFARGCMFYDHSNHTNFFIDWEECPKFLKIRLSDLLQKGPEAVLIEGASVRCYVDQTLNYEESISLRELLIDQFKLNEFSFEEIVSLNDLAKSSVDIEDGEDQLEDIDMIVNRLLGNMQTDRIDPARLVEIYNSITLKEGH